MTTTHLREDCPCLECQVRYRLFVSGIPVEKWADAMRRLVVGAVLVADDKSYSFHGVFGVSYFPKERAQ